MTAKKKTHKKNTKKSDRDEMIEEVYISSWEAEGMSEEEIILFAQKYPKFTQAALSKVGSSRIEHIVAEVIAGITS